MERHARTSRGLFWANAIVSGYALTIVCMIAISMIQPLFWYWRGGPLIGAISVRTVLDTVLALDHALLLLLLVPFTAALLALAARAAVQRTTFVLIAIGVALLPLAFFETETVFASVADLRVDVKNGDGDTVSVWMLSDGGTSLISHQDGSAVYIRDVSRGMIAPVLDAVRDAQPTAQWHCAGDAGSGTYLLHSGRKTIAIEGCPVDRVGSATLSGMTAMQAFDIQTLFTLMTAATEDLREVR